MQAINTWLIVASQALRQAGIKTARLDSEIILAHTIRKNRTFIHAHGEDMISNRDSEIANARLDLRTDRVPIAYIIGHKEFYGRRFNVSSSTLIPRPESEDLVTLALSLVPKNLALFKDEYRIVDVGTGSGNIGITLKCESPDSQVTLIDSSPHALKIAASNASHHTVDVRIIKSDLLLEYPFSADLIVANLPYVDPSWERSPETNHEPALALFAHDNGLELIKKLLEQAGRTQRQGTYIVLEADPIQHTALIEYARRTGYTHVKTIHYAVAFKKA